MSAEFKAVADDKGAPRCSSCKPDYCACEDFYRGRLAFWRGEYDHLLKPKGTTE